MNTFYILIGASFLLNLIVVLAFRASDKKDRSLKNLNQQVKNFRYETTSFMNRFTEIARDCEQNITSRIEYANTVQDHLAESIDMVLVHQKELDELSGVCENYGNALKKLKAQTEQAENRVYAVQAEVRKTEAVKDFTIQAQRDFERLSAQLESLKADYVRLVASTEQDLKAASASQKEENREMLEQFSAAIERGKSQLSEYVALERRGYDDMCREQEAQAEAELMKLDSKINEIEGKVASSENELNSFAQSLSESLSSLGERRDLIFSEMNERALKLQEAFDSSSSRLEEKRSEIFSDLKEREESMARSSAELNEAMDTRLQSIREEMETACSEKISQMDRSGQNAIEDLISAIKSTENTLEEKLNDAEEETAASIASYREKLSDNEKAVEQKIADLQSSLEDTVEEIRKTLLSERDEVEKSIRELIEEKDHVLSDIRKSMTEEGEEVKSLLGVLKGDRDALVAEFNDYLTQKENGFKEAGDRLEGDRIAYVQRCREELKDALDEAERTAGTQLQRIRDTSDDFLKGVTDRLLLSEKSQKLLEETAYGKIKEAEKILNDYSNKIKTSEASLNEQMEQITALKESIWNLQQEEKTLQDEVDVLCQDKDKLLNDTSEAKRQRIYEEANLVRLKGQQKVIEEKRKEEEAKNKEGKKARHAIEEMDIIIGEEEIDVSDDE